MTIYSILLATFLHFIMTAINIMEFFLTVRIALAWKETAWLKSFDVAGNGLINKFTTLIDKLFYRISNRHLSINGAVIASLITLELTKMLIGGMRN